MASELRVALFLGAGASVPLGLPETRQLKTRLFEKYRYHDAGTSSPEQFYLHSILSFSPFEDIEHVLQCIKEIDDFLNNTKYGSNYMLNNPHKWVSAHPNRPWPLNEFSKYMKILRRMVEDDVFENYSWNHPNDGILGDVYGQLFAALKSYSRGIHVFTTNYDRAIEEYCSNQERKCRCIDGFQYDQFSKRRRWDGSFTYPIEEGITNVYLRKLHGSLTWKRHKVYGIVDTGEERRSTDANYTENLLVYPTVSPKDGQEIEPYSTVREEFKKFMEAADVCVVIGFSFRDEHINTIFSEFYKRGKSIIVISPSADNNVFGNLFKKPIPSAEGTVPHESNKNIMALYRENKRVITINQPINTENIADISSLVSAAISNLATGTS